MIKEQKSLTPEEMVQEILQRVKFLQGLMNNPEAFLIAQNALLYSLDLSPYYPQVQVNRAGLPIATDQFYQRDEQPLMSFSGQLPRILNIGSGPDPGRKLSAINIDLSPAGRPDVVADAQHLPFRQGIFSVVRASHVLEHIPQAEISATLNEWGRVLHQDGELQIAVPDAAVTFSEIITGETHRGQSAVSLAETTAPLAQIYGLGYDNEHTDKRWLHQIIFSYALLEHFLNTVGFYDVNVREANQDLAAQCEVNDDSQNHYTLLVSARRERKPHTGEMPISEKAFDHKVKIHREKYPQPEAVSFIIPVHNELKNLQRFLFSLEHATNKLGAHREFIFVVNDCRDGSEEFIRTYAEGSYLDIRIVNSARGVVKAFETGIDQRNLAGYIGKIDADIMLHPHVLDLLQMHLTEQPQLQVTYAEPVPLDSENAFNTPEHNPPLRSQRLYIHGRTSLYRDDPFRGIAASDILDIIQVEDMFLSFYLTYFYGLDSIERTPHALIYSKTVSTYEDLVKQLSRSKSEMERIFAIFPPFAILEKLLDREIYHYPYKSFVQQLNGKVTRPTSDWTRLESTK